MSFVYVFLLVASVVASVILYNLIYEPVETPVSRHCFNSISLENHVTKKDEVRFECFFSSDYFEARDRFKEASRKANAHRIISFNVPDVNHYLNHYLSRVNDDQEGGNVIEDDDMTVIDPTNDTYTTDVAVFYGNNDIQLWHLSGTHGGEGYAGSAAQLAILDYLATTGLYSENKSSSELPTIVLVHAVNPVGFAKNRRVNEDNIDLNRNFLTPEKFKKVLTRDPNFAGYVDVDNVYNPTKSFSSSQVVNDLYSLYKLGHAALTVGIGAMKKALVSGNYHKPTGLSFGGQKLSQSARNLISLTKTMDVASAKSVILLDVHTGLGPSGVDTLMNMGVGAGNHELVRRIFPTEYQPGTNKVIGGIQETMADAGNSPGSAVAGYELTVGTVTEDFCNDFFAPHLSGEQRVCLTQEFGTRDMLIVGTTLTDENYAFHHGSAREKRQLSNRLKNSFYVQTSKWRDNVANRGFTLWLQAFNYQTKPENFERSCKNRDADTMQCI